MVKSTDGGVSWTRPQAIRKVTDPCFFVDPVIGRCVEDGVAGARNDLAAAPSVDIANGAPTGADATNFMLASWADGRDGLNNEHVMVSTSTNGTSWSAPAAIETAGDRGYYAAPAFSPNGTDAYVVYNAFTTPFRDDTTSPRSLVGVVKHADVTSGGLGAWSTLNRGATAIREARARTTSRPNSSATTSTRSRRGRTERPCGTTRATRPIARRSTPGGCRCARRTRATMSRDRLHSRTAPGDVRRSTGHLRLVAARSDAVAGARPEEARGAASAAAPLSSRYLLRESIGVSWSARTTRAKEE